MIAADFDCIALALFFQAINLIYDQLTRKPAELISFGIVGEFLFVFAFYPLGMATD